MTAMSDDEFMTVAEVASVLKLNQQTVRNWIEAGTLPALRVGRRVRIRRQDFDQWWTGVIVRAQRSRRRSSEPMVSGPARSTERRFSQLNWSPDRGLIGASGYLGLKPVAVAAEVE